jgi:PAT family beta-lactamase induction signal transducer AmpG
VPNSGSKASRSKKTLAWTFSTYLGEGLPWSFLHQIATEFLTAIGAPNRQISATSWLHGAVTLKFLWSPLVDLFGSKRNWVIVTQVVMGLGMFAVAAVAPTRNLPLFWVLVGALSIVHAAHDIACDGFYLQALDKRELAAYAGVRMAAFRAAMFIGASGLVYLAGKTNWLYGFGAAGVLMILIALVNRWVMPFPTEHRPQEELAGGEPGVKRTSNARAFWEAYRTFFTQPGVGLVLPFMLLFRLGDIMMFAMSKPLLRDLGVTTSQRGILNGFGIGATILGSILGGTIIARYTLARCLIPMTYLQNLAIPLYIVMAVMKPGLPGIAAIVLVEQFVAGIGATAYSVFQMQRSRAAFSASHFAFATALVALASMLSGAFSGPLNEWLGHPLFFTVAFLASVPSLVLVLFVPKKPIEP